jgi:hypothetical protein
VRTRLIFGGLLVGGATLTGCTQPLHLQYDYSRTYTECMTIQADLSRESVSELDYVLSGTEGLELRQRATESATDQESAEAELTSSALVQ